MATLRGTGMAAVNYPTGMNLGGDPSQALIHATTSRVVQRRARRDRPRPGSADRHGADRRGDARRAVRPDRRRHGRHRHRAARHGHVREPRDAPGGQRGEGRRDRGPRLGARARRPRSSRCRSTTSCSTARARCSSPGRRTSASAIADLASRAQFQYGRTIAGRGAWMKPKSEVDPDTGAMDPDSTQAYACTIAEVEVDTETGVVDGPLDPERVRGRPPGQPGARAGTDHRRGVDGHDATRCTRPRSPTTRAATTGRRTSPST